MNHALRSVRERPFKAVDKADRYGAQSVPDKIATVVYKSTSLASGVITSRCENC